MNNEQLELLDEAYNNYLKTVGPTITGKNISKPEFIWWTKNYNDFVKQWGLKIEERELTYSERYKLWFTNNFETGMEYNEEIEPDFNNNYYEVTPTKVISITYKDKTIESYE